MFFPLGDYCAPKSIAVMTREIVILYCLCFVGLAWFRSFLKAVQYVESTQVHNQHARELISARNYKYVPQVQQPRPESPPVTLTWHACEYKVHILHQSVKPYQRMYLWWSLCTLYATCTRMTGIFTCYCGNTGVERIPK